MEDKGVDFSKPPPEPDPAQMNRSVPRCFMMRESGLRHRTNSVPRELQWAAEDKMVMKTHEEFKCELPDISRSTFLMVFSPDGTKVASTHGNHNVYVTDLTSGKNVRTLSGHPRTPWCIAFHPSSNQILASGCLGGQVRVWDLTGGSEIWMAESQTVIASLAFHPVDRMLAIASYNELHFWDWSRPEPFAKRHTANEKEKVRYVAFDALGHKLITGVANAPVRAQTSQWDRVAAPQPPPPPATGQLDSERRITVCYRYMVEQYEQLVQRYCDLSRARNTLTMDRGTDPMEMEGEASGSGGGSRRVLFSRGAQPRLASGTDEASASHSSTSFLTPSPSGPTDSPGSAFASSAPQPPLQPAESTSPHDTPRRNPRFDITLPSFSNFRSRSSSASSLDPSGGSLEVPTFSVRLPSAGDGRAPPRSRPFSLSPPSAASGAATGTGHSSEDGAEPGSSVRQMVRNLMAIRSNEPSEGTSTEVNSALDSEQEGEEPAAAGHPHPLHSPSRGSRTSEGSAQRNNAEATPAAVTQLSSQFHRLRASVYDNDSRPHSHHVFSAETQAAERRLLSRLHEILERPLPEPRAGASARSGSRLMPSRRSAFQPRTPQPQAQASVSPSSPPTTGADGGPPPADVIGGVRYGITLLSRHIDNMQRLCRARLEILQLQQIRRMWQDLQSQIYTLHGAVGGGGAAETGVERGTSAQPPSTPTTTASATNDLLTDDDSDGPSGNGEVHWRMRRTPQTSRRSANKTTQPRNANTKHPMKRSRLMFRVCDSRRLSAMQMEASRRLLNRQAQASTTSSTQATSEEPGDASSSQAPSDTSTTTEGTGSEDRRSVRGVKRKSTRGTDTDPLFRPRPSAPSTSSSSTAGSGNSTSNLAAVMRETIVQLENMLWRHRQGGGVGGHAQRSSTTRLSRFTRQREERMLRNLWDTESSHESSRDDQSEGDSTQQRSPGTLDTGETEWSRDSTRTRAREVLLLMVDSLTQFFESDTLSRRTTNEALNDRIHSLYVLLQLALNLTDLLLEQLVNSRRELEARRPGALDSNAWSSNSSRSIARSHRHARYMARTIGRTSLAWRRILRRAPPPTTPGGSTPSPPPERATPTQYSTESGAAAASSHSLPSSPASGRGLGPYSNIRSAMMARFHHSQANVARATPVVPIVRVNDLPAPPPEATPSPRLRPHSPPPHHPVVVPPRFLHPGRYSAGGFVFDESTSEDSSPQEQRSNDYLFVRAPYTSSVLLTDTPMSPHHRIQAWDFSNYQLPNLADSHKNIVVGECKIHNDASVDISQNGQILVTLLPSGRLSMTTLLGVYSLNWATLGQLLYTTSFEQSIVSVSLSPTNRHLVVGLASRRVTLVMADRHINAQIFRLEGASPGRKGPVGPRGRLMHLRDLELSRQPGFMSLNCIRWAPDPGQGLVYGTNTGHLKILR